MANTTLSSLSGLEDTLEQYFVKKAPALPTGVKDALVTFAPWIALIMVILSLPLILAALGLGSFAYPFAFRFGAAHLGPTYYITILLSGVTIILNAMAVPGLMKRQMKGWHLVYFGFLVSLLSSLLRFDVIGFVISALVGFYLLFQVKSRYK